MKAAFLTRVSSAVVFAILVVGGILLSAYTFALLFLFILILAMNEYFNLIDRSRKYNSISMFYKLSGVISGCILFLLTFLSGMGVVSQKLWLIAISILYLFFILELFSRSEDPFQNIAVNILGIVYIAFPLAMANLIAFEGGVYIPYTLLGIIFLVWANDSCAYLVGSRIGRTKLFERISPKKTWEGLAGGLAGALITAYLLTLVFPVNTDYFFWLPLALIVVVFGTLGDLVESMLKRSLHLKDSGDIMPGHGGVLDRFDAIFFSLPFSAVYIYCF